MPSVEIADVAFSLKLCKTFARIQIMSGGSICALCCRSSTFGDDIQHQNL